MEIMAHQRSLMSNERLGQIVEDSASEIYIFSVDDCRFTLVNRGARENLQFSMDELRNLTPWDLKPEISQAEFLEMIRPLVSGELSVLKFNTVHRRKDGTYYNVAVQIQLMQAKDAPPVFFAAIQDVTNRNKIERELRDVSGRLNAILQNTMMAVFVMDDAQHCVFMNSAAEKLTGYSFEETQGRPLHDVIHHSYPDGRHFPLHECAIDRAFPEENQMMGEETFVHKDGHFYPVGFTASPIRDDDGKAIGTIVEVREISQELAARDAMHRFNESLQAKVAEAIEERKRAEEQLLQSQKMEAIGQLTGGIAHDFNNLLQVIGGSLELLARDIGDNPRAQQRFENAMGGVARGAKLASHLLSFGRQQPLQPKSSNVGRLIEGMSEMLTRSLGETVEVETIADEGIWNCLIDSAQVENAVLNLAINARDAMNGHGKLTIEASNAILDERYASAHADLMPGQYVMLAVTDTGSGMPPEILEKAFDPFFTTKEPGSGTGLGLSMVYGLVKQSGGHINIYSEVDVGTTVRIYLPRTGAPEDTDIDVPFSHFSHQSASAETILVVEDDMIVRTTAVETLREFGFTVVEAVNAEQALAIIESGAKVDLLFTDVVMPGALRSPELARRAREILPDLGVLFTSGYTENAIVHSGRLDECVELLSKPYTNDQLFQKISRVMAKIRQTDESPHSAIHAPAEVDAGEAVPLQVLIVEDEILIRMNLAEMLYELGAEVKEAGTLSEAQAAFAQDAFDIIITDISLPDGSADDWVTELVTDGHSGVIISSGHPAEGELAQQIAVKTVGMLGKPYELSDVERCLSERQCRTHQTRSGTS
jgi:PAS domain S-box-containing protein